MKRVLVYGITSENVGDDLFLKILEDRLPEVNYFLFAPKSYKQTFGSYKNWKVLTEKEILPKYFYYILKTLHVPLATFLYVWIIVRYRIDLFLFLGGSIFMEGKSNLPKFVKRINRIHFLNPKFKIAIIGSNFGPSKTKQWEKEVESMILTVDDVCFRDKVSYELFSHLPNVRWGNDIVMHMKPHIIKEKQKAVCVNIRSVNNWPDLYALKNKYIEKIISIIDYFQELGYSINLLSFCSEYGDDEITDELYNSLTNKNAVNKYYYNGDLNILIDVISSSEYMVGTRFHAIVLGLIYQLRVLPISYSIKTENMLKTYHLWQDVFDYKCFCNSNNDVLLEHIIKDYTIEEKNNTMFKYVESIL